MGCAACHIPYNNAGLYEGGGDKGQRGIDMSPAMPHTTARQARTCTSCHAEAKSLGYGTHDGRYMKQYSKGIYVDISNEKGQLVTKTALFIHLYLNEKPSERVLF